MSIKAMTRVWEDSPRKGSALLLLLAIADFANDQGEAWPSVDTLAKKCRMSRRNVQTLANDLAADGDITIQENAGPRGCNIYRLNDVGGAKFSPVQTSDRPASKGGANQRPKSAPDPSGNASREPKGTPADGGQGHQAFIDLWHEAYEAQFGRRYVMHGGADGKAAKDLLAKTRLGPGELMRIATAAWGRRGNPRDFWACENKTDTIRDFAATYNRIVAELDKVPHGGLGGESIVKKAGRTPPPGLKPLSQRPPPGMDEDANEITSDEYQRRFPLSLYYDEQTFKPLG